MTASQRPGRQRADEIRSLAARLAQAEAELQDLTGGEIDAILDPETLAPILLRDAQVALRKSEGWQRELIGQLPIIACEIAPDGTAMFCNQAVHTILGYRPDELIGRGWWESVLEDPTRAGSVQAMFTTQDVANVELTLRASDGSRRDLVWSGKNRYATNGALLSTVAFGVDLTERARAEEVSRKLIREQAARAEAEAGERRSALLSDASHLLGSSLDYPGTLKSIASLAARTLADCCMVDLLTEEGRVDTVAVEHSGTDAGARLAAALRRLSPDDDLDHPVWGVMRTGKSMLVTHSTLGDVVWLCAPLTARGRVLGTISYLSADPGSSLQSTDVSLGEELGRRAALAVDNTRLYQAALQASKAKSEFLATMSHELRTPLNAIIGYSDLLLLGVPEEIPAASKEHVQRVEVAARHLLDLIDEILTLSRIEAGKEDVIPESVGLRAFLMETASIVEPLARKRNLTFRCDTPRDEVQIRIDPRKVRQILLNLLGNAVKFTETGEVFVSGEVDGNMVIFTVRDTGPGIATEHLERIFDPFWQVEQGRSREVEGAGLGLSVTRKLARLMGGDITASSNVGAGTTFVVRIHGADANAAAERA